MRSDTLSREVVRCRSGYAPSDDMPSADVDDTGDIDEAPPGSGMGDVRYPIGHSGARQ